MRPLSRLDKGKMWKTIGFWANPGPVLYKHVLYDVKTWSLQVTNIENLDFTVK